MIAIIFSMIILGQTGGIEVTQSVIMPKVLQKSVLTEEEHEALINTVSGMFMGVSIDSNYVYINERPVKVDKRSFNFKDLPQFGEDVFIRMEVRGKEKVGIYGARNLDDAVYFRKGFLK